MTVTFEPPLRTGFSAGTAVTWDKPLAYFKADQRAAVELYRLGNTRKAGGYAIDPLESWT